MVDEGRRRILRLAALAGATLAGGAYLLADRLRGGGSTRAAATARAGPPTSPTATSSTTTTTTTTGAAAAPSSTTASTTRRAAAATTTVLCRDAWGAAPPTGSLAAHEITGLMVHHTAVALADNREAPDRVLGHQRFHQSKGFADIAYHVVVDADGNVYEGRDPGRPGETFTDYDPTGWFLVVCEGNFDEQPLPGAQRDAMARVLAWAAQRYGVAPETVASHRQHAHTRCPGDAIHAIVLDGTLGRLVAEHAGAGATLETVCGPEATARIDAIRAGAAQPGS